MMGATSPTPHPFKHLTDKEMAVQCSVGLCFSCDELLSCGHKCKLLFDNTIVNNYDLEEADDSLMMMISRLHIEVQGASLMYIEWMMNYTGGLSGFGIDT